MIRMNFPGGSPTFYTAASKPQFGMTAAVAAPLPITSIEQLQERCESVRTEAEATVVLKDLILDGHSKNFLRALAEGADLLAHQALKDKADLNAVKVAAQEYVRATDLIIGLLSHFPEERSSTGRRIEIPYPDGKAKLAKALRSFDNIVGGVGRISRDGLAKTLTPRDEPNLFHITHYRKILAEVNELMKEGISSL